MDLSLALSVVLLVGAGHAFAGQDEPLDRSDAFEPQSGPAAQDPAPEQEAHHPPTDLSELGLEGMDGFDLDDFDIEDEFALLYAEDVVVSATRHEQRISESPSTITVISREELAGGSYRDLADVLRMVPGGDVFRLNPMSVTVGLRAGTTGTANRVLLLVDGRDMALHTTGQPQWNSLAIDLESIERIEVIRGPGSSIYGANALQGVVNVITRRPTEDKLSVEGSASLAGAETYSADARAHGTRGALRWWTNAGYDREGHFENPERLAFESLRLRGRIDLALKDGLDANLEAGYGSANGRVSSSAGDGSGFWHTPYALGRLRWPSSEILLTVETSAAIISQDNEVVAPAGSLGNEPLDLGRLDILELYSRSAELTAFHTFYFQGGHRLMVGGAGRLISHLEGAILRCPDVEKTEFELSMCEDAALLELRGGAFVQAEVRLSQSVGLTAGLRSDVNNIHPGIGLSPRLAMVWTPKAGQAVRASVGRAYRKPSFFESYLNFRFSPTDAVPGEMASRLQHLFAVGAPNPNLRNETVSAIETGWLGRFAGGRLVTTVDVYGMLFEHRIEGLIENIEFIPGLAGTVSLHPDARISYGNRELPQWAVGGEVAVSARPTRWLRLDAHYNHQGIYDVFEDGSELSVWTPQHRFNLGARLDIPGGWRLNLSGHWSSSFERYTQDPESSLYPVIWQELGNRVLVLGSASYLMKVLGGEIEVGVGGRNLLFSEIREFTGISRDEGVWGGEVLRPQARLFVRGRF